MEENAYQLLGLEQGPAATEVEIKKAYRKLALLKHPDKNPDNPRAADEFATLQKAYDLLLDKEARAALDVLFKAKAVRAERVACHDEKRRKMMEDLEKREKGWVAARTQEETARAKLHSEMERLRRQAAERAAKTAAEQRAAHAQVTAEQQQAAAAADAAAAGAGGAAAAGLAAAAAPAAAAPGELSEEMRERLGRTLKVSWSRKEGEYSAVQLRQAFAVHGPVEDVVLREGKKRKGSALVVMATAAAAAAAAQAVNGHLSNPLLVVPFYRAAAAGGEGEEQAGAGAAAGGSASGRGTPFSAAAATQDARPVSAVFPEATRMRHAASAPAFAAGGAAAAAGGVGAGGGLGQRPTAPLFAAGARQGSSSASLFPGAAAAASMGQPAAAGGGSSRPLFASGGGTIGSSQQPPPAAASAGAGGQQQQQQEGAAPAPAAFPSFAGFGSFQPASAAVGGGSSRSIHALNGGLEDATLSKMRQAAERRRLIEELEADGS